MNCKVHKKPWEKNLNAKHWVKVWFHKHTQGIVIAHRKKGGVGKYLS